MITIVFISMFLLVSVTCILWVKGIDKMKNEHPNYKGEDFLDWDDNKTHTEGKI